MNKQNPLVLIATENTKDKELLLRVFEQAFYEVLLAENVSQVFEYIRSIKLDLLILQANFQNHSFHEVFKLSQSFGYYEKTPVLYVFEEKNVAQIETYLKNGNCDVVFKPLSGLEMQNKAKNLIDLQLYHAKLKDYEKKIARISNELAANTRNDDLTGLLNRKSFTEMALYEVARFFRSKKPFTLLLAEVDQYELMGDMIGVDGCQKLLKEISTILNTNIRGQDLLCRWGESQFMILLSDTQIEGSGPLIDRINALMEENEFLNKLNQKNLLVTLTYGLDEFDGTVEFADMARRVDIASFKGRMKGGGCVVSYR